MVHYLEDTNKKISPAPRMAQDMRSLFFIGVPDASFPHSTVEVGLVPRIAFVRRKSPPKITRKEENGLML
jgi:hypothetical protein